MTQLPFHFLCDLDRISDAVISPPRVFPVTCACVLTRCCFHVCLKTDVFGSLHVRLKILTVESVLFIDFIRPITVFNGVHYAFLILLCLTIIISFRWWIFYRICRRDTRRSTNITCSVSFSWSVASSPKLICLVRGGRPFLFRHSDQFFKVRR